jgi:hypothetical protein
MSMTEDRLSRMIEMQRELQTKTYGHDFTVMSTQDRVHFIKENVLAMTDELHELLAETSWKPWAKSEFLNEEKAFSELIDAWHFMMNIMLVITPDLDSDHLANLFTSMYFMKRDVNVQRQEDGYDGQSTKCPKCKRALDDVGATVVGHSDVRGSHEVLVVCVGCATDVTHIVKVTNG